MPSSKFFFRTIVERGYADICNAVEKLHTGKNFLIQQSKFEVSSFDRKPTLWINSWNPLLDKLKAKNFSIHFSNIAPTRNTPYNLWYSQTTRINNCMLNFCNKKNIPFANVWHPF